MNESTSVAPERDQQLLDEFSLSSEQTLRKLLNIIDDDEHELYVYLQADDTHFVTEILNIDWSAGHIWLGTPYEKALSAQCNINTAYVMVSFPNGVKIQFTGVGILKTQFQGTDALKISIPEKIVRLQRRNYFRVMADDELNSQVKLVVPQVQGDTPLIDLSLAGCGFYVEALDQKYREGDVFRDVRLTLPDDNDSMLVELVVRNIKILDDHPDQIQLGCAMKTLERGAERRLQRFLLATERRQRTNFYSIN